VSVGIVVSFTIFTAVPQSPTEFPSELPSLLPIKYPSVITIKFYRQKYFVDNLVAGIYFFWRANPSVFLSAFPSVLFFLLPTEMAMELELPTIMTPTE